MFFTDITNTISINNSNTATTNLATKANSDSFPTSAEGTLQLNHQIHDFLRTEFISTHTLILSCNALPLSGKSHNPGHFSTLQKHTQRKNEMWRKRKAMKNQKTDKNEDF